MQGLAAIPFVYCLSYIFKTPLVGYSLTVLVLAFLSLVSFPCYAFNCAFTYSQSSHLWNFFLISGTAHCCFHTERVEWRGCSRHCQLHIFAHPYIRVSWLRNLLRMHINKLDKQLCFFLLLLCRFSSSFLDINLNYGFKKQCTDPK
jgi:hypothetical protein